MWEMLKCSGHCCYAASTADTVHHGIEANLRSVELALMPQQEAGAMRLQLLLQLCQLHTPPLILGLNHCATHLLNRSMCAHLQSRSHVSNIAFSQQSASHAPDLSLPDVLGHTICDWIEGGAASQGKRDCMRRAFWLPTCPARNWKSPFMPACVGPGSASLALLGVAASSCRAGAPALIRGASCTACRHSYSAICRTNGRGRHEAQLHHT